MSTVMRISFGGLAFGLCLLLGACTEEPAPLLSAPVVKKIRKQSAEPPMSNQVEKIKEVVFLYNPIGQRDPFQSLLQKETAARKSKVPRTPLEKFDLGQFQIQALLIGKGAPRAMVSAPDGKNYILKPGLKIGKNDGEIVEINKNEIVVEESTADLDGNVTRSLQSILMPEKKSI